MKYVPLKKLYYTSEDSHKQIYESRFNAPTTKHFQFSIKEFNRKNEFPAFFYYTEELVKLIETVYQKFYTLTNTIYAVPNVILTQFYMSCIIDEVKSTNDVEGIQSTRRELKAIMAGTATSNRFQTVIHKYDMLDSDAKIDFKSCESLRKFYDEFALAEVVANNESNKLDGKIFRKDSVSVYSGTDKILHQGVYPESKIIDSMTLALEILNDEQIPSLIRLSVFHYLFGYIHPFYDGNGRTVRFITSYYLKEWFHFLAGVRISVIIKTRRKQYYEMFKDTNSEYNCGDLTPFVYEFISMIAETFDEVNSILQRKLKQYKKYEAEISKLPIADNFVKELYGILLQAGMFFGRGISIKELVKITGKSSNTIRTKLKSLPQKHVIIAKHKNKLFYRLNPLILKIKTV